LIPGIDFLYIITQGSSSVYSQLCTLREEIVDGELDYRWHNIMSIPTTDYGTFAGLISIVNYTNPRLWYCTSQLKKPNYFILPATGMTPDKDSGYTFILNAVSFVTSNYDMGFMNDDKLFTSVDIKCTIPGGNTIAVYYEIDNSGSWTQAGSDITSGTTATRFVNAKGRFIKLKLVLDTDSASETPVIHGLAIRAIMRPLKRKVWDFAVRVADDITLLNGIVEKNIASLLATQLKNADDPATQTAVVVLTDIDGTDNNVVLTDLQEVETMDETGKRPERHFYIKAITARVS